MHPTNCACKSDGVSCHAAAKVALLQMLCCLRKCRSSPSCACCTTPFLVIICGGAIHALSSSAVNPQLSFKQQDLQHAISSSHCRLCKLLKSSAYCVACVTHRMKASKLHVAAGNRTNNGQDGFWPFSVLGMHSCTAVIWAQSGFAYL